MFIKGKNVSCPPVELLEMPRTSEHEGEARVRRTASGVVENPRDMRSWREQLKSIRAATEINLQGRGSPGVPSTTPGT